jgi:hypothetical protein
VSGKRHFFAFSPPELDQRGGGEFSFWNFIFGKRLSGEQYQAEPNCVSIRVNYCRFAVDGGRG